MHLLLFDVKKIILKKYCVRTWAYTEMPYIIFKNFLEFISCITSLKKK